MQDRIMPILTLLLAMASIQLGASIAKQLFPYLGAAGTTVLRTSIAAVLLLIIWRPWKALYSGQSLVSIGLYGMALGSMNLMFYLSLQYIPLGIAVALEFTGPLAVALLAARRSLDILWVVLAVVGILLLLPLTNTDPALPLVGILYALGAGACWALYQKNAVKPLDLSMGI